MSKSRVAEKMCESYPLRIGDILEEEIKKARAITGLKRPDVMRMSMALGIPLLVQRFKGVKR